MKNFKGKAIYNPSGRAGEYAEWACNFYVGCSNGCEYCYCKKGILAGVMGQDKPQLKKCFKDDDDARESFRKELIKHKYEMMEHGLFFSFTTDPMLPETIYLTTTAARMAVISGVPVKILTKCAAWVDAFLAELLKNGTIWNCDPNRFKHLFAFGFTLTGHDELEPDASYHWERIEAMRKLHNAGFKTFASIEPIIDFESARACIEDTFDFCDLYKIGLMSGKKYDDSDVYYFMEWLSDIQGTPKFYIKESLRKLIGYQSWDLGENFVERDYKL